MKKLEKFFQSIIDKLPDLPTVGIFAFALASTWSLFQFFNNHAIHPTPLYWIPAALVEIVTAWLTKHAVEAFYQITRSNVSKQDRRFFWGVAVATVLLVTPTFAASILANWFEFQGQVWLALLFPVSVAGCAIGAQIPRSVARHNTAKDTEGKAELRKAVKALAEKRAELEQARTDQDDLASKHREELAQVRAELAQDAAMKEPSRAIYERLCDGMNGDTPSGAGAVNKLLNDEGFYGVADSTARNWAKMKLG